MRKAIFLLLIALFVKQTPAQEVITGSRRYTGPNITFGPTTAGNVVEVRFREASANGTNYVVLKAPTSLGANVSLTLPQADAAGILRSNGSGVLSFDANISHLASSTSAQLASVLSDETGTGGGFVRADSPTISTPTISGAIVFPDGIRQTFNPDGTNAGINVGAHSSDPSNPTNGDMWYNSTTNELKARINGANVALGSGGGGGSGSGDVVGPSSSTDNAVARFNGTTGKVIKNSTVLIDDSGNVSGVANLTLLNNSGIRTSTSSGDKLLLQAYDVDGATYTTFGTLTAGNTPTFSINNASATFVNDGCGILDTDATHTLSIVPGSNLTANRTLTISTGDASRTITLNGNTTLNDWFDQSVKQSATPTFVGANLASGTTTLGPVAGNVNMSGASSLKIPIGGSVNEQGHITVTTNQWAAGRDAVSFFDGSEKVVFVPVLQTDTPSNGQVPVWDATNKYATWETISGGGGGQPGGSGSELQYRVDATTFGGVSGSSVSGANITLGGILTSSVTNAGTNDISALYEIIRNSSGTPTAGFGAAIRIGLESSTTNNRDAARIAAFWTNATDGSRTSAIRFDTVTSGGPLSEAFRFYRWVFGYPTITSVGSSIVIAAESGGTATAYVVLGNGGGIDIHNYATNRTRFINSNNSNTTGIQPRLDIMTNSTSTPTDGYGAGIDFYAETSTTEDVQAARIASIWTNITHASRSSAITFSAVRGGGAVEEVARVTGYGNLLIGATAADTSATNTLGIAVGTAPASSPTNLAQVYASNPASGDTQLFARGASGIARLTGTDVYKTSNQSVTFSTTLVNATDLSFNVEASTRYAFRAVLHINCGATGGVRVAIGGTATATSVIYAATFTRTDTGAFSFAGRATALDAAIGHAAGTAYLVTIEGTINVNTAGTLVVRFAQQAADGTPTTLLGGSTFHIRQL